METKTALSTKGNVIADTPWSEFRYVTVLFADIDSSVQLLKTIGAEKYQDYLDQFHSNLTRLVTKFDGVVDQYLGDGALCFFYHSREHSRGELRALEVAMANNAIMADHPEKDVTCSYGIATGHALFNETSYDAKIRPIGDCINLAARLKEYCAAGGIIVCERTYRHVRRSYNSMEQQGLRLKGFEHDLTAYQITGAAKKASTGAVGDTSNAETLMVGRTDETDRLSRALSKALSDGFSAVKVIGEAGIGKTKLVRQFLSNTGNMGLRHVILQCQQEDTNTDFHPFLEYILQASGVKTSDQVAMKVTKVSTYLHNTADITELQSQHLLHVLGLPSESAAGEEAAVLRASLFQSLSQIIHGAAGESSGVIFVLEDAQWVDPSTRELVTAFASAKSEIPTMVLIAQRHIAVNAEIQIPHENRIFLNQLPRSASQSLVDELLGADLLSAEEREWICDRADDIPFYIQIFCEHIEETRITGFGIDKSKLGLSGIFDARLDLLPDDTKRFIQTASVLGRQFNAEVVLQILDLPIETVNIHLDALLSQNLIDAGPNNDGAFFVHDLVREAIYENLGTKLRKSLHVCAATAFIAKEAAASVIARHFIEAGSGQEAMPFLKASLFQSFRKGALQEARNFLDTAFEALKFYEEGTSRSREELALRAIEGPLEMVRGGPGNPLFGQAQRRSINLMDRLEQTEGRASVVYNFGLHDWATGRLDQAEMTANAILLTPNQQDEEMLSGNTLAGLVAWHKGDNALALSHLNKVVSIYDVEKHKTLFDLFLKDFGVFGFFYAALSNAVAGDHDQAQRHATKAHELSEQLQIPHPMGFGLLAKFLVALIRFDIEDSHEYATKAIGVYTGTI